MFDFIPIEPIDLVSPITQEIVISGTENDKWAPFLNDIAADHLNSMSDEELDNDWKLNEFFGTIAVINLLRATERLESITKELNHIGAYVFEQFQAIDGRKEVDRSIWKKFMRKDTRGVTRCRNKRDRERLFGIHQAEAGCYLSHYELIKKTKAAFDEALKQLDQAEASNDAGKIENAKKNVRKYSRLLVLEDDGGFGFVAQDKMTATKHGVGRHLREALKELPADWDMLYFVVGVGKPAEEISPKICKLKQAWSSVAYAINYTMYADMIDHLKKIEDPSVKKVLPLDNEFGKMHKFYNVYAIYPSIVYQQAVKSTIISESLGELWQGQPR